MENKIKLTAEQLNLFFNYANILFLDEERWFHIPFWFRRIDQDTFELYSKSELPEELLDIINGKDI